MQITRYTIAKAGIDIDHREMSRKVELLEYINTKKGFIVGVNHRYDLTLQVQSSLARMHCRIHYIVIYIY